MGLYAGNKFVIRNGDFIVNEGSSTGIGTTENKKIIASDPNYTDYFGYSVAVGSGRIVVGSRLDDDKGSESGSAYIYDLDGNNENKKTASDGAASDYFGTSVAVGSGRIVVGAPGPPGQGSSSGSVYIFDLNGNELDKKASNGAANDYFGTSVAVGCDRIVVGAFGDNSLQGSAYIYDLDGNNENKITASDGAAGDRFGISVAVGCGRIVVGAYYNVIGSNTEQGSAYIFDLDGNQLGIITASDGGDYDYFGRSVAVGSGRIVVGAYGHDVGANVGQGSAYIYDLDGNQLGIITASDGATNDYFGKSVAVGSGRIVVGATDDDDKGSNSGSAYIYDLDGNNEIKITASDGASNDDFGDSVAVGSGRIVVGAWNEDPIINSLPITGAGSAYMWEIDKTLSDYYDEIIDHYRY